MRSLVACLVLALGLATASCTTMEDCCECLAQANELNCSGPPEECVDGCFGVCEHAEACYCTAARRADCSAECGCAGFW